MKINLLREIQIIKTVMAGFLPFITFVIISIALLQIEYIIFAIFVFVISTISPLIVIYELRNGIASYKVIINEKGITTVSNKEQVTIDWNEIKYLVFSKERSTKYISVYTKEFQEIYDTYSEYYEHCAMSNYKPNKGHAFMEYRADVLDEIMKYYSGKMINEEIIKRNK